MTIVTIDPGYRNFCISVNSNCYLIDFKNYKNLFKLFPKLFSLLLLKHTSFDYILIEKQVQFNSKASNIQFFLEGFFVALGIKCIILSSRLKISFFNKTFNELYWKIKSVKCLHVTKTTLNTNILNFLSGIAVHQVDIKRGDFIFLKVDQLSNIKKFDDIFDCFLTFKMAQSGFLSHLLEATNELASKPLRKIKKIVDIATSDVPCDQYLLKKQPVKTPRKRVAAAAENKNKAKTPEILNFFKPDPKPEAPLLVPLNSTVPETLVVPVNNTVPEPLVAPVNNTVPVPLVVPLNTVKKRKRVAAATATVSAASSKKTKREECAAVFINVVYYKNNKNEIMVFNNFKDSTNSLKDCQDQVVFLESVFQNGNLGVCKIFKQQNNKYINNVYYNFFYDEHAVLRTNSNEFLWLKLSQDADADHQKLFDKFKMTETKLYELLSGMLDQRRMDAAMKQYNKTNTHEVYADSKFFELF